MTRLSALLLAGLLLLRAGPAWPMQFTLQYNGGNCGQCAWLLADGVIEPGTTAALRRFVLRSGELPKLVRFNSPGGDLAEAMRLGRYLRAAGFETIAAPDTALLPGQLFAFAEQPSSCFDACVYAFLGGVHRRAAEGSLALHGPAQEEPTLSDYVLEMGVDPRLLTLAAGPGLHVFRRAELIGLRIADPQAWREESARPPRVAPG